MSKINVIVPIYNVEKYIARCIDSILKQTFTDFQLILVDDGSPDNCGKICDEYAETDKRVFVIHKGNGGLADARNAGIEWTIANSDSEWITFIDSDDWIHRQYLELLYNGANTAEKNICCCNFLRTSTYVFDDLLTVKVQTVSAKEAYMNNVPWFYSACGKLFKSNLFINERFPKGRLYEDGALITKLLFENKEVAYVPIELYFYYINPLSITNTKQTNKHIIDHNYAFLTQIEFFLKNNLVDEFKFTLKKTFQKIQYQLFIYRDDKEKYLLLKNQKGIIFTTIEQYKISKKYYKKTYKQCLKDTKLKIKSGIKADIKNTKSSKGILIATLYNIRYRIKLLFFTA